MSSPDRPLIESRVSLLLARSWCRNVVVSEIIIVKVRWCTPLFKHLAARWWNTVVWSYPFLTLRGFGFRDFLSRPVQLFDLERSWRSTLVIVFCLFSLSSMDSGVCCSDSLVDVMWSFGIDILYTPPLLGFFVDVFRLDQTSAPSLSCTPAEYSDTVWLSIFHGFPLSGSESSWQGADLYITHRAVRSSSESAHRCCPRRIHQIVDYVVLFRGLHRKSTTVVSYCHLHSRVIVIPNKNGRKFSQSLPIHPFPLFLHRPRMLLSRWVGIRSLFVKKK